LSRDFPQKKTKQNTKKNTRGGRGSVGGA
jgi:hypothetical protein